MPRRLFRETTPNEYTPLAKLTPAEQAVHDRLKAIAAQEKLLADEAEKLRRACKHPAFYDVPGFPYDVRYCAVCEAHLETI